MIRWGYTEEVLGDLHWLAELSQSDELLLRGVYGLAEQLNKVHLPLPLQRPLSKKELETHAFVEQHNRRFKPYIDRIRDQERLLIGDSPAANGNYHGLDYLAVRADLPDLHHEDHVEIKKILQDVSINAKLGWSVGATLEDFCIENLMPWVAKHDSKSYAELACSLKLNTLHQQWAQFKLGSIQGLIFQPGLPNRHDDLSQWGKDLMQWMCLILQGAEGDPNTVEDRQFEVNPEVLRTWAEQSTTDFLQLANEYFALLSKSGWYCRGLYSFTDTMLCLLLRFQPDRAMNYYHRLKTEGVRTIFFAYGGVETFFAQLWRIEDCSLPEHRYLRRTVLEECLNDEEIMFMTLTALAGGGQEELWSLVTQEYIKSPYAKERNLGVSILPWFGNDKAIEKLEQLKSDDPSQWVRGHAWWAYEVAQQERSCREVYREALRTHDLFRISAVFEQIKPALSPTARWWHREIEKEEGFHEESLNIDPRLEALHYRFWYRWGNSSKTKSNIEVFGRKLREYCRGEKLPIGPTPRIAPWWKPTSD